MKRNVEKAVKILTDTKNDESLPDKYKAKITQAIDLLKRKSRRICTLESRIHCTKYDIEFKRCSFRIDETYECEHMED